MNKIIRVVRKQLLNTQKFAPLWRHNFFTLLMNRISLNPVCSYNVSSTTAHCRFTSLPVFHAHISLNFLLLKQKKLKLMVFWQMPTNVNMETWTPLNLPFIFEMQILSLSQSAEQCLFLFCIATLPAFPSLCDYDWKWVIWKISQKKFKTRYKMLFVVNFSSAKIHLAKAVRPTFVHFLVYILY